MYRKPRFPHNIYIIIAKKFYKKMLKNRKVCVANLGFPHNIYIIIAKKIYKKMLKNRKVCVGNLGFLTSHYNIYF